MLGAGSRSGAHATDLDETLKGIVQEDNVAAYQRGAIRYALEFRTTHYVTLKSIIFFYKHTSKSINVALANHHTAFSTVSLPPAFRAYPPALEINFFWSDHHFISGLSFEISLWNIHSAVFVSINCIIWIS